MTRWTQLGLAVLSATALASALPGCQRGEEAGDDLVIWWAQWDPAVGLSELAAEFTQETGIPVKVHQIPWSSFQDQVFLNFGNTRTDFDMVIGDSQWLGRGASNELYVDLTEWLPTAVDLTMLHPRALDLLCSYPPGSKTYYAAPCQTDAIGFAYRKDWFNDVSEGVAFQRKYLRPLAVPKTWNELRETADFFYRPNDKKYGVALLTGRGYDSLTMGFQNFLWAEGARWGDPETFRAQGFIDSREAQRALDMMIRTHHYSAPGGSAFEYDKTVEAFNNGSTAMAMMFFAFAPGVVETMGDKVGFFAVPTGASSNNVSLGGQGFSISTKTPAARQERAKKFIAWFLKPETQQKWVAKTAGFTANKEILASDAFRNAAPYNAPLADSLDRVQDFWNVPQYNELLAVSQKYLGEAFDNVKTPEAALSAIAREHEAIFREAGLLPEE